MSYFIFANDEESTSKVNIDELYEKKQARDLKQLSIFNKILNRVHTRIRLTGRNKRNDTHVWFNVPEYIFGEPVYDKGECIAYVVNKLEENGFLVKYMHPNTIFVAWNHFVPSYIRTEFKKKTGKLMNEKGEITDPKEKEALVDEDDVNAGIFNDSRGQPPPKKEQKDYRPIDKYKPTGKFIYDPNILERIDKKVSFG